MKTQQATKSHGPLYVAVYEVSRHYGGPEEGGWWFDRGEVLGFTKVRRSERRHVTREEARMPWNQLKPAVQRRLTRSFLKAHPPSRRDRGSVLGGPDIELRCMRCLPYDYPAQRPHYE